MVEPPRTADHGAEIVYEAQPWIRVDRHRITTPDGVERPHHAVRLNPVAIVTAIDRHGRALLLHRHRWIVDKVGFESPGGILEPGEKPSECARREMLEETGFEVDDLRLVAELEPMPGLVETPHHVFVAGVAVQRGLPTDHEEAAELMWIPLSDTSRLLTAGRVLGAGTAIGLMSAAALFGHRQRPDSPGQELVTPPQSH
ncbi:NUDIX hydrolase [Nocardia sp. NPDC057227]|uniref:NUDIX hydrolase n=1 Tax=Nocardia sp. NPDC057227 TaxID=3346056 RepID=UPI003628764A